VNGELVPGDRSNGELVSEAEIHAEQRAELWLLVRELSIIMVLIAVATLHYVL